MSIKDLLPIGSVVLLKGGKKRIMVFGVKQTDTAEENNGKEYDYIGVLYPEGNMGQKYQFLFNHEDIAEVSFKGLDDEDRKTFIAKLSDIYK